MTDTKPTLQCHRCGYRWTPRGDVPPERIKSCPECKHRKWRTLPDTERPPYIPWIRPSTEKPRQFFEKAKVRDAMKSEQPEKQEPTPVRPSTDKLPHGEPEHSCYVCGEPAEFSIEGYDLNWTDRGVEYINNVEWFCGECYAKQTK